MANIDPVVERRQLQESYEQMTEDELCAVAEDARDLTDLARETLQAVITDRRLNIQLKAAPPAEPRTDDDEDDLVCIWQVRDMDEAERIKEILDAAQLPCCLGPDNITDLKDFKSGFDGGVEMKVFASDLNYAGAALARHLPQDDDAEDGQAFNVTCPKCHSPEIVLDSRGPDAAAGSRIETSYNWHCDACSYQWKDNGIEQTL